MLGERPVPTSSIATAASDEGMAMALALDTQSIPAGARYAVWGGVGFFKNRAGS